MEIVAGEAEFVTRAALDWLARLRRGEGGRSKGKTPPAWLGLSAIFEELPVAVQRRCVQLQLLSQGIMADYNLVEQLRAAADRPVTARRAQPRRKGASGVNPPGGTLRQCFAVRDSTGLIHLQEPDHQEFSPDSMEVCLGGGAGEVEFAGAKINWRFNLKKPFRQPPACAGHEFFDADRVGPRIWLRHWRPGDRFQPIGMAHPVKLQDFFTNQKVPQDRRRKLMVAATATGELFWVEGMRISERFKLTQQTIRRLQWRWKRP
jgi:tRNA(Ile)-lysidine synthetase-like protein